MSRGEYSNAKVNRVVFDDVATRNLTERDWFDLAIAALDQAGVNKGDLAKVEAMRPIVKATATLLRQFDTTPGNANQRLYRCAGGHLPEFVIVSAVVVGGRPETYIFKADAEGEIATLYELRGSQKDTLSHEDVLTDAGYEVRQ